MNFPSWVMSVLEWEVLVSTDYGFLVGGEGLGVWKEKEKEKEKGKGTH